jgi:alkyldihydroxyacetonephosphate synthase
VDFERLRTRVSVSTGVAERLAHARDLWPRNTLALATGGELPPSPAAVAWPEDEEGIAHCLAWAEAEGAVVVPYGAGSGVCGAAAGRAGALVLDLKRMNHIGRVDGDTVRVQPGVLGQHLEDHLERAGRATRHSPSSIWCSTVGGWAASRSAGQFSSKYGKFEDMVLAMRVVAPAERFGTGRWAAGEDLGPWVMGTEGALGIISELLVRTVPLPRARKLCAWRFASVEAAWDAMRAILQAELHPAVLRLYDAVDTRIAGKGTATQHKDGASWLDALRRSAETVPALRRHLLSLPLALPRLVNGILGASASACVLIAGWEGDPETVEILSRHGAALLSAGVALGEAPGEHWYAHRHEVSYKLAPIFERGGFADTMEVASTWARLPGLYAGVRAALGRHAIVMAHFSHVYREGCSIYFSFAGLGKTQVYDAAWRDALEAAAAAGGTVAHHHGVGQLKAAAAARELAGVAAMFHALKQRLDPRGVLNPGRLFPEVRVAEPSAPAIGIDPISQIATIDADEPAASRDARLAAEGWVLRFPSSERLRQTAHQPGAPWESPVLGASARLSTGRAVLVPVPRSAAGPDPRAALPLAAYETLTVPIVRLDQPAQILDADFDACVAADVRPARRVDGGVELRGPAAAELAAHARKIGLVRGGA